MKHSSFSIDNSAILYLALMRKKHTNVYRFTMTMREEVCPRTLQQAVNLVCPRFPTIFAGFRPGFFSYTVVPAVTPPRVQPDPGCLITMPIDQIHRCAYRVYYRGKDISIEAFHALTDGYGAVASFSTMIGEYLRLRHGLALPAGYPLMDVRQEPSHQELEDAYLTCQEGKPLHLPSRYAYQLPGTPKGDWNVIPNCRSYPIRDILDAAHRHGISATALFSGVMASAIMELQQQKKQNLKPVRIMIPVDLRKMFGSTTLRNFILYALPTLEPEERNLPLKELFLRFQSQIQQQLDRKRMAAIMAYNVKMQDAPLFRTIPRAIKCALMRLIYRFFGESNSCITLTNLGQVRLPEEMQQYVENIQVILTPRAGSPYNCAIISYGDQLTISMSRFCREPELDDIFFRKLEQVLYPC